MVTLLTDFIRDNYQAALIGFGGLAIGLLKGLVVDAIKERISRPSKLFPDMRGIWCIKTELNGVAFIEQLTITWQYTSKFKGELLSPTVALNQKATIRQKFVGEFVDSNTAIYTIVIKSDELVKEYGTGILRIDNDLCHGTGMSVVYGVASNTPVGVTYTFERNVDIKGNRLRECSDDYCKNCVAYKRPNITPAT